MTSVLRRRTRRRAGPRARRGFTTVELIVAIIIMTVGVLGLASTAVFVVRMMRGGTQQGRAAYLAMARLDSLRGVRCPIAGGSATKPGGFTETWFVNRTAALATSLNSATTRLYEVTDSVSYKDRGATKAQTIQTVIQCLP